MRARSTARAGIAALTASLLVGPWVAYNLTRFEKPVFVSANVGGSLCGGNNDLAYFGPRVGLWIREGCPAPEEPPRDQSDLSSYWTRTSLDYARPRGPTPGCRAGAGRSGVERLRTGPDGDVRRRRGPTHAWCRGPGSWRSRSCSSRPGTASLCSGAAKHRGIRWPPCSCSSRSPRAVFFGIDRYRVPVEVALVVLAAVGIDAFLDRRRGGAADHTLASASSR